jgi:hypothetical protein
MLTLMRCDCCGGTYYDQVAELVIWEAVVEHREQLAEKARRDRAAWAEAERLTREALE